MIDPSMPAHRSRLAKSLDHWWGEMDRYRKERRETILNYAADPGASQGLGVDESQGKKRVWGNLIQMSALAHTIPLAYNNPGYKAIPISPEADAVAPRLQEFLNRWVSIIELGNTARMVAMDSYVGWGIIRTNVAKLPPRAAYAIGQVVGPYAKRISQDHFLLDGSATDWADVGYMGDLTDVPLDEALEFGPFLEFNPEGTANLEEFARQAVNDDSRIHTGAVRENTAQAMTRLVEVYFPAAGVTAIWPANDNRFGSVSDPPLLIRPFEGHHSGVYDVLSHLDVPDNLVPIAQSSSTKQLHFLFNELAEVTANQALEAKVNPVFEIGSERDMERLENADDRKPVGVSNIQKIGIHEKPGPTQGQTAYMLGTLSMFKEFSGNLDDTLGLSPTAPTATQSQLIRQATGIRAADARRRMDAMMSLVGRKLAHLALVDHELTLPARQRLGGTELDLDMSFVSHADIPRPANADAFLIDVVAQSMEFRAPEARLAQLNEAVQVIFQAMTMVAQGAPLDMSKFVEMQADYRNLPELRDLFSQLLPEHEANRAAARDGNFDPNKPRGLYTRVNQSESTNSGDLTEQLTQFDDGVEGAGVQLAEGA